MGDSRKLWIGLAALLVGSFAVLLWTGRDIYQKAPPMPERVVAAEGELLYTRSDIETGRQVWQSTGGMQLGSIWGHGGYVAPDWTADWLHRESMALLDTWAREDMGAERYAELAAERQGALRSRLEVRMRRNTYEPGTGTITLDRDRVDAIR